MPLLQNDAFLTKLAELYDANRSQGSVWVTFKQHTLLSSGRVKRKRSETPAPGDARYVCLIRATDGKKKISTHVEPTDTAAFNVKLSEQIRIGMTERAPEPAKSKVVRKKKI